MTVKEFETLVEWYYEFCLKVFPHSKTKWPDEIGWWTYPVELRSKIGDTAIKDRKKGLKK